MHLSNQQAKISSMVFANRWMLVVIAFVISFPGKIPTLFIIVAGLLWLTEIISTVIRLGTLRCIGNRILSAGKPIVLISFLLLIMLYIIGVLYSDNMAPVRFELEKKSLLLLFPLYVFTSDPLIFDRRILRDILLAFLAGLLIISLYDIVRAIIDYIEFNHWSMLYYSRLSRHHHPSYLSLYAVFAIAASLRLVISETTIFRWLRILLVVNILWLMLFVLMLSSKAGFLSLFIVVILSVVFLIRKMPWKTWLPSLIVIFVSGIVMALLFSGTIRTRLSSLSNISLTDSEMQAAAYPDGVIVRVLSWEVAWEEFLESPWFGTGTGDYHDRTREKLSEKNLTEFFGGFKNAHNQYLQTAVTLGAVGFAALLMYLFVPLISLRRDLPWLYCLLVIIVSFNLMFESMLETQAGVFFIVFFQTILYRISKENTTST